MTVTADDQVREATPSEIAALVRGFREVMGWTQDTLATLARIEVRTIQRVERGERSSRDTKRAIASAFGLEDLDFFSRAKTGPTPEKLAEQKRVFDRDHIVLDLEPATGRSVALAVMDMDDYGAIGHQSIAELAPAAQGRHHAAIGSCSGR